MEHNGDARRLVEFDDATYLNFVSAFVLILVKLARVHK